MLLTEEETGMLNGDKGPAVQKAMQILVALGESFGAERLVPINNVHMAGSSVLVAEEADLPPGCESLGDLPCQREKDAGRRGKEK